jgi:hypothetical protein
MDNLLTEEERLVLLDKRTAKLYNEAYTYYLTIGEDAATVCREKLKELEQKRGRPFNFVCWERNDLGKVIAFTIG